MKTETSHMHGINTIKAEETTKDQTKGLDDQNALRILLRVPCDYIGLGLYSFHNTKTLLSRNLAKARGVMEKSNMTPVHNKLVFSSLFLFVICFAGLIHVEIELYAHRQMLQALSQPKEEKVELKNTANDEKTNEMIMLFPYSHLGEFKRKTFRTVERPLIRIS